jgi:integrase
VDGAGCSPATVETKSATSRRTVELTDMAIDALRAQQDRQPFERKAAMSEWKDHNLIFPSEAGTPLEQSRVTRHWDKAVKAAGIPHYRIHDLRHTVASHPIMGGFDSLEVARILGHSSASLAFDVHGHMAPTTKRKAADAPQVLLKVAAAAI